MLSRAHGGAVCVPARADRGFLRKVGHSWSLSAWSSRACWPCGCCSLETEGMTDRDAFFAIVRARVFGGSMTQDQVDGCNAVLDAWEKWYPGEDRRFVAYALATAYWE